jgi:hypothetical protein
MRYRPLKSVVVLTFVLALAPAASRAQWTGQGVPLCAEREYQHNVEIVPDGFGGLLATWVDERGGSHDEIFARRLTVAGLSAAGWPDSGVRVSPPSPWGQNFAQLVPDFAGGMFVAWTRTDDQWPPVLSFVQHLLPDGSRDPAWPDSGVPVVPWRDNTYILRMVADGAGGVALLTQGSNDGGTTYTLWAQRLTAAGVPAAGWTSNGLDIGPGGSPDIEGDGTGGLIVGSFYASQLRAKHAPGSGAAPDWNGTTGVLVRNTIGANPRVLDLETDGAGGAYFLMYDVDDYLVRVGPTGAFSTGWSLQGRRITNAQGGQQFNATLVPDGAGGVYSSWTSYLVLEDTSHVRVKRFDADGTDGDGWPDAGVPVEPGFGNVPRMAPRTGGGVFVTWQDARDVLGPTASNIYLNSLNADGTRPANWDPDGIAVCTAPRDQLSPVLASDGAGGVIAAWTDDRNIPTGNGTDLYAAHVLGDATVGVAVSLIAADATWDRVRLAWHTADVARATLERSVADGPWIEIASLTPDGTGRIAYQDRAVGPELAYRYRLRLGDGTVAGEVAITTPGRPTLSLAGAWPHPASLGSSLAFELDRAGEVEVALLDVAGRTVGTERLTLDDGRHLLPLAQLGVRTPGVYLARLRHEGRTLTRRVVVR